MTVFWKDVSYVTRVRRTVGRGHAGELPEGRPVILSLVPGRWLTVCRMNGSGSGKEGQVTGLGTWLHPCLRAWSQGTPAWEERALGR